MKRLLLLLLLANLLQQAVAQVFDPHNFVLENVYIAAENVDDSPINLMVRDNKLELVSQDDIPIPDGLVALDANAGFLMGDLTLGESPSFMVVDADPRADFEVLLTLESRMVFAVHDGKLRQNRLQYAADMFEDRHRQAGWHAYTPPPVALATLDSGGRAWNHWETKNTQHNFFSILAMDRQYWLSQNDDSRQQVGDLDNFEGGEIRDLRLGLYGTLDFFTRPWGYNVVAATNAFDKQFEAEDQDNFRFIDYRLDIPLTDGVKLSVGKQKEPISMERIMTLINLPMQERSSVADAMLLSRNFGVHISGNALDRRMSWATGVFNDFIDADESSLSDASTTVTGRITWLPYVSNDLSELVHLGLAVRASNGNQGYLYRAEPEFNKSPLFVDTGFGKADEIRQYNLEASWRRGPFWVAAEYTGSNVDSPTDGTLNFGGYYVTGAWIVTGEMRKYNYKSGTFGPVPISRSVYQNGSGALELAIRWSSIDLNDDPVAGGTMDILSIAASWWLSPIFNASLNYRYIANELDDLDGRSSGLNARILLKLR